MTEGGIITVYNNTHPAGKHPMFQSVYRVLVSLLLLLLTGQPCAQAGEALFNTRRAS